jgi:hypothetical protein
LNCNERSTLYIAYLLYKLSELEKCFKDYITSFSSAADSTNDFDYNHHIQKQLEIIELLKQIIKEINISKVLPNYLLQLKIQRLHHGWTGRGTKRVFG